MATPIFFNRIFKDEKEQIAVNKVLSGNNWHGDGPAGKRVEEILRQWLSSKYAFLTTSCTHALEMAMMVLDVQPGDEIIMPSFTFVSTANAVYMRGAVPVFAEIQPFDLNIDPADTEKKITAKTKAIIPVHYAGVSVNFDALYSAIDNRPVAVIEDAAQAIGAFWKDKALGTIGDIGCFSFHDTKNITCGEGGAFLTQNDDLAKKAEWVREKGTNRSAFLRGEIDKYTWVSAGSSYIPSDILAGILEVQLHKRKKIHNARKEVWQAYEHILKQAESKGWITLPKIPEYAQSNYHIFHFLVNKTSLRDPLLHALRQDGIEAAFHYIPLHNSPFMKKIMNKEISLPQTERLAQSIIRLPLYPALAPQKEEAAERVYKTITRFFTA